MEGVVIRDLAAYKHPYSVDACGDLLAIGIGIRDESIGESAHLDSAVVYRYVHNTQTGAITPIDWIGDTRRSCFGLSFSRDGTQIVVADRNRNAIRLYSVATGGVVQEVSGHPLKRPRDVTFAGNGDWIIANGNEILRFSPLLLEYKVIAHWNTPDWCYNVVKVVDGRVYALPKSGHCLHCFSLSSPAYTHPCLNEDMIH